MEPTEGALTLINYLRKAGREAEAIRARQAQLEAEVNLLLKGQKWPLVETGAMIRR